MTEVLLDGVVFPESPRWRGDRLWFSDMHGKRVMTVETDGTAAVVAHLDDRPSGLGFLPDGSPLVVLMARRQVVKVTSDRLEVYADLSHIPCSYLNDMVVGPSGAAYVDCVYHRDPLDATDRGDRIALVRSDGTIVTAAQGKLIGPNGLALSPDGQSLVVAEPRAHRVTTFTITADGSLTSRKTLASGSGIQPDGLCLDAEGAVWIGAVRAGEFLRLLPGGRIANRISAGGKWAIACVLGGSDRRTLFMTTANVPANPVGGLHGNLSESRGFIETARVEVPGAGTP